MNFTGYLDSLQLFQQCFLKTIMHHKHMLHKLLLKEKQVALCGFAALLKHLLLKHLLLKHLL